MSVISVRLPEQLLNETKSNSKLLHISPTGYIRKAIVHMNQEILIAERKKKLQTASLRVRKESMVINNEFSQIEHDPEA